MGPAAGVPRARRISLVRSLLLLRESSGGGWPYFTEGMMLDTKFVGWYRKDPSSLWAPIVYDVSEERCFNRLLDGAPPGGDKMVLKTGDNPNANSSATVSG